MPKLRLGFTLTEVAIILAIIGLMLGAIWVVATMVYNNTRTSTAKTELLQIAQSMRALYSTSMMVDPAADMAIGAASQAGSAYIKAGVFPSNTLLYDRNNNVIGSVTPWGGDIAIRAGSLDKAGDSFVIVFNGVSPSACVDLLMSAAGWGRDAGIYQAGGGSSGTLPESPISMPDSGVLSAGAADAQCPALTPSSGSGKTTASTDAVAFWFKLVF